MSIQKQPEMPEEPQQETMLSPAEVAHDVLGYEMLRAFMRHIETLCPPPRGDWGSFLRKAEDLSTQGVRQLTRYYMSSAEDVDAFLSRAIDVVRLYMEEALRRCLLRDVATLRRKALASMMVTMRNLEAVMLGMSHPFIGLFYTFNEWNVSAMLTKLAAGWGFDVSICPSFETVMRNEMKLEVISLMRVTATPSLVTMTTEEVRALISYNGKQVEEHEVATGPKRVINYPEGPCLVQCRAQGVETSGNGVETSGNGVVVEAQALALLSGLGVTQH